MKISDIELAIKQLSIKPEIDQIELESIIAKLCQAIEPHYQKFIESGKNADDIYFNKKVGELLLSLGYNKLFGMNIRCNEWVEINTVVISEKFDILTHD